MNVKVALSILLLATSLGASAQRRGRKVAPKPLTAEELLKQKQDKLFGEMVDNTQRLFVIDSVVVDKSQALNSIPLSSDLGKIVEYNSYFKDKNLPGVYVYVNGFENKCYYAENDTAGVSKLYCREKLNSKWSVPQQIRGIESSLKHINFPFMTSDGETFFFAAKSDEGLGGYDIYMTRYDSDEGKFLEAENVGLPYNSHDDDFLFVEDDIHDFAWFATTRRQGDGKVCVYTIKTSKKRENYVAEAYNEDELKQLAMLSHIRDTWKSPKQRDDAMKQFEAIRTVAGSNSYSVESAFIVNDELAYNDATSFKSAESRSLYAQLMAEQAKLKQLNAAIDGQRVQYRNANGASKAQLAKAIQTNEKIKEKTIDKVRDLTLKIRKLENN